MNISHGREELWRNQLRSVPNAGQDMVSAAMKEVVAGWTGSGQVRAHWQRGTEMLRKPFSHTAPPTKATRGEVLGWLHDPRSNGA